MARPEITLPPGQLMDEGSHGGGKAEVDGDNLALDVLHAIVNGKTGDNASSRTVDVQVDRLVLILAVQVEHHANDLVGELVVDLASDEDDALSVQTVVNVHPVCGLRAWHSVRHLRHSDWHHLNIISAAARTHVAPCQRSYRLGHWGYYAVFSWDERWRYFTHRHTRHFAFH
mmetsp:Transcript_41241/g.62515  ORF Transcript_41241/g.62515 Transcript_41241/m.62515 type:complete len:172 (-) Transcript_41241:205-720(-)